MIRCYVTDRHRGDLLASAKRAVDDRVDFIQIREKDLSARELFDLVCQVRDLASGSQTRVLVNDRMDIALAAGIDGVHLPSNGLPPGRVRPLVSVLGISTHSLEEAVRAEKAMPDFMIFGPIFETPGKKPVGLESLRLVTSTVRIPILAIGGITPKNVTLVLNAGASGFAAIRHFQD
jgi:thiamine-phosphate pyrophosphorylase